MISKKQYTCIKTLISFHAVGPVSFDNPGMKKRHSWWNKSISVPLDKYHLSSIQPCFESCKLSLFVHTSNLEVKYLCQQRKKCGFFVCLFVCFLFLFCLFFVGFFWGGIFVSLMYSHNGTSNQSVLKGWYTCIHLNFTSIHKYT